MTLKTNKRRKKIVKFVRLIIDKNNKRSDEKNMIMLSICSCEEENQEEFVDETFECDMRKIENVRQIQRIVKNEKGYNIYTKEHIFILNEIDSLEKLGTSYIFKWN